LLEAYAGATANAAPAARPKVMAVIMIFFIWRSSWVGAPGEGACLDGI
jgi:hypothetical protein